MVWTLVFPTFHYDGKKKFSELPCAFLSLGDNLLRVNSSTGDSGAKGPAFHKVLPIYISTCDVTHILTNIFTLRAIVCLHYIIFVSASLSRDDLILSSPFCFVCLFFVGCFFFFPHSAPCGIFYFPDQGWNPGPQQ